MNSHRILKLANFAKILSTVVLSFAFVLAAFTVFLVGFKKGYLLGEFNTQQIYGSAMSDKVSSTSTPISTSSPINPTKPKAAAPQTAAFGGPQLWEAVNKRRVQLGVNPLSVREEICTIASIRLNQLLTLGKLDGHEGFSKLPTDRSDLKWIFDKYNLAEFLVSGATSAQNAVDLWENSLGHKQLMSGGEFVWGCIYAQNGFGVAIAAY